MVLKDQLVEDLFFGGEVIVEACRRQAGLFGDLAHGRAMVALGHKEAKGGLQDLLLAYFSLAHAALHILAKSSTPRRRSMRRSNPGKCGPACDAATGSLRAISNSPRCQRSLQRPAFRMLRYQSTLGP